jgi:hypothetical protein
VGADLFGTSSKRLAKLASRGWTIVADGWHDDIPDLKAQFPDEFDEANMGEIHSKKFTTKDPVEVDGADGKQTLAPGDHKITVERRYGKTDVWIDDQFQLFPAVDGDLDKMKPQADKWLQDTVGSMVKDTGPTAPEGTEECPGCHRNKDVGQACWNCGGGAKKDYRYYPKELLPKEMLATRVAAREAIERFFADQSTKTAQFTPTLNGVKHAPDIWAKLITDAISSFNQGLEDYVEPEDRRASRTERIEVFHRAVDVVGEDAFRTIAYLVASQGANNHMQGKANAR